MAVLPISQKGKERENRTGIYFPPRHWLLTHVSATFHMALPPSAQLQAEGIRLLQCRACPSNASWTPVDLTLPVFSRNHSFLFLCLSISLYVAYPPWLIKVPNSSPPFTASFKDTPSPPPSKFSCSCAHSPRSSFPWRLHSLSWPILQTHSKPCLVQRMSAHPGAPKGNLFYRRELRLKTVTN